MVEVTPSAPYFKLAEYCKITAGQQADLLVNLHDGTYIDLDKKISGLFDASGYIELNDDPVLLKIIDLFTANQLGAPAAERSEAVADTPYHNPYLVSNAIVAFGDAERFATAVETLLEHNCPFFEFRVASNAQAHEVKHVIDELTPRFYDFRYGIVFFMHEEPEAAFRNNIYFKFVAAGAVEDGPITAEHLVINATAYAEAQSYHMGLNGKVFINENLEVFCHPTHSQSFGNLASTPLADVVPAIAAAYWHVSKNEIEQCKTCRFRHICCDFDELVVKNGQHFRRHTCNFAKVPPQPAAKEAN